MKHVTFHPNADAELTEIYKDAPRFSSYGEVEMALAQERVVFTTPVYYWVSKD